MISFKEKKHFKPMSINKSILKLLKKTSYQDVKLEFLMQGPFDMSKVLRIKDDLI